MLRADDDQALAFRLAGHHLHARTDPLTAVAACGLQEFPPGWAAVALHARSEGEPAREEVVVVNAMRGAPYLVPRADVAIFTRALVPDDDGLKVLVGANSAKEVQAEGLSVREALDRVSAAARDGLAAGPLDRDAFHQALRERLPAGLLPWCRGCQSHHVRPGLWRALGVTEMPEKATYALAVEPEMALHVARAELARRFLRCYGPATHTHLASWAQTAPAHAKSLLELIENELEAVRVGGSRRWILAADAGRLEAPPPARGVRLLGGFDPYVAQPDRDALVPDPTIRKKLFPPVGRPGVILHDGAVAGLWRSRKKGELLEITPEWVGEPVDLAEEAAVVAGLRGCSRAEIG